MKSNFVTEQVELYDFHQFVECRVAKTRDELKKAYSLVYREYLKRSFTKEHPSQMRFSVYNALPQTTTFIAIVDNEVIATATVVPDSPLGLPMDDIYNSELNYLRHRGKRICEITMLTSDTMFFKRAPEKFIYNKVFFMLSFFKVLFDYVKDVLQLDGMCIAINPRHKTIFDFLLFEDLGGLKSYPDVNGAPAIAKYLEITNIHESVDKTKRERLYQTFLDKTTPPEKFKQKIELSSDDLKYFFTDKSAIFRHLPLSTLVYIKTCYPQHVYIDMGF